MAANVALAPSGFAQGAVPESQTYTGSKKCASCHFKQYMTWKKDNHSKAFTNLPAKYRTDGDCLKCHTTGFGTPTGFKDAATTPVLAGVTCESCHGPGNVHEEVAKTFGTRKLTEAEEKQVRGTIHLIPLQNVCFGCHQNKAHKKHPKYDKQ